jgi:hypothetical protein
MSSSGRLSAEMMHRIFRLVLCFIIKIGINTNILLTLYPRSRETIDKYSSKILILPNDLALKNSVDVTGGKPIAA